jgi:hypothetical protein
VGVFVHSNSGPWDIRFLLGVGRSFYHFFGFGDVYIDLRGRRSNVGFRGADY